MKHKLSAITATTHAGDAFQVSGIEISGVGKARKKPGNSVVEELILSEFNIDAETMEEHLEELVGFMMQQDSAGKLRHD
jgi:hypothetical protein